MSSNILRGKQLSICVGFLLSLLPFLNCYELNHLYFVLKFMNEFSWTVTILTGGQHLNTNVVAGTYLMMPSQHAGTQRLSRLLQQLQTALSMLEFRLVLIGSGYVFLHWVRYGLRVSHQKERWVLGGTRVAGQCIGLRMQLSRFVFLGRKKACSLVTSLFKRKIQEQGCLLHVLISASLHLSLSLDF